MAVQDSFLPFYLSFHRSFSGDDTLSSILSKFYISHQTHCLSPRQQGNDALNEYR